MVLQWKWTTCQWKAATTCYTLFIPLAIPTPSERGTTGTAWGDATRLQQQSRVDTAELWGWGGLALSRSLVLSSGHCTDKGFWACFTVLLQKISEIMHRKNRAQGWHKATMYYIKTIIFCFVLILQCVYGVHVCMCTCCMCSHGSLRWHQECSSITLYYIY